MGPLPDSVPTLGLAEWSVQSITAGGRDMTAGFTLGTSPIDDVVPVSPAAS